MSVHSPYALTVAVVYCMSLLLSACATAPISEKKPIPEQRDRTAISQLAKTDFDRMADVEFRENTASLRVLMTKLYKRNPNELRKSTTGNAEEMVTWVFEGQHQWKFEEIQNKQGTEAIFLSLDQQYQGDRVLPFIVGLYTMLTSAHGGKTEFFFTDTIEPQALYNVARNIEIAVWKLSNAYDSQGNLLLLTNEANDKEKNLSFEREFGRMIGRTDLYAITLAEKKQRMISRVVQSMATAVFLPF